jgi:iron complex outermembrane receptor protein
MKFHRLPFLIYCLSLSLQGHSQQGADSMALPTKAIPEVVITSYPGRQALLSTPATIALVDSQLLQFRTQPNLVSSLNIVPGVRMEERSPASYRLSLRGSLLRSPFGVRDVKIYLDEYPFTDGGGNSYLNNLDLSDNSRIEIIKGPDGSLFGANTGGVVRLIPSGVNETAGTMLKLSAGSYGLFAEQAATSVQAGAHLLSIRQSYDRSDGYRDNSAMHKTTIGLSDKWSYAAKAHIKLFLFYSDLYYQTPGGLTLQQFNADPEAARTATATLPSAATQHAAVFTKLLFGGLNHEIAISKHLTHVIDFFGSGVDFKNPFITNYETRREYTQGFRTYFEWHDVQLPESKFHYSLHAGAEWTQTQADIHNYDNNQGVAGALQAADNIVSQQHFYLLRFRMVLYQRWIIEASSSLNYAGYRFKDSLGLTDHFSPQWMPRIATSYQWSPHVIVRASVSRGYSTPTTAEIRPSDNQLYLNLQPESGWNYETGVRLQAVQRRLLIDLTLFHYRLQQAIVSHLDSSGNDYFTNAGGTRQTGVESSISYQLVPLRENKGSLIQSIFVFNNTTWNAFYFHNYQAAGQDYSGNKLTGVPAVVNVLGISCGFDKGFSITTTYNHTGRLPLDDANDAFAHAYNLVQATVGKKIRWAKTTFMLNIGMDNSLNQHYSLGNDINAAAGRYYNPAAARNICVSLKTTF